MIFSNRRRRFLFALTTSALVAVFEPTLAQFGASASAYLPFQASSAFAEESEMVVDAVLASVDGKPITLSDVLARLATPRQLSLKEVSLDLEARRILEQLISEDLIEAEAEARHFKVGQEDVNLYVQEVAARNSLSLPDFEAALQRQGGNLDQYRQQVRIEILRSKIIGQISAGSGSVSPDEIDSYLKEHPEFASPGPRLKLREILVSSAKYPDGQAQARVEEARAKALAGEDFAHLASEYSDAPDAADGGLLDLVAEKDLSSSIFDAVFPLKDGEISEIVTGPTGLMFFKLEQRLIAEESDSAVRANVQKILAKQKQDNRVRDFFETEIYKEHSVDKKI